MATFSAEEYSKRIDNMLECIIDRSPEAELTAMQRLEADMKGRIFRDGKNSRKGNIGKYLNREWIKRRKEKGRQTNKVDLAFLEEQSGGLSNAINTGTNDGHTVLGVVDGFVKRSEYQKGAKGSISQSDKVKFHEKKYGKVFQPTKEEVDILLKSYQVRINKIMKQCLQNP